MRGVLSILFGAVLPVAFLVADPIVFRPNTYLNGPYLGEYRAFFYIATLFAAAVTVHAAIRTNVNRFEAGLLYGAALVAAALGLALLPLSIIGIMWTRLSLLGLSPFVAAWIYVRCGLRAHAPRRVSNVAAKGALVFLLVSLGAQLAVNESIDWTVFNVRKSWAQPVLRAARIVFDAEQLVVKYEAAISPREQQRLSLAYRIMTGRSIEERLVSD